MQIYINSSHLPLPGNYLMMRTRRKWQSPKEWSSRDFKVYLKNWKGGETSVILWALCLVVFSTVEAKTTCSRGRRGKNIFRRVGADMWWNYSLILLHICTRSVPAHYLFFPFYTLRWSRGSLLTCSSRSLLICLQQNSSTNLDLLGQSQYKIKGWNRSICAML